MSKTYVKPEFKKIKSQIDKMEKKGCISKAVELCKAALKDDPTNPELHIKLGDLYLEWHLDINQAKQYVDDAITEYQRSLESSGDQSVVHYKIGVALFHKGELNKALGHLNIAIDHNPNYSDAYYMIAKALKHKGEIIEAETNVRKAISLGGLNNSRAHYLLYKLIKSKLNLTFKERLNAELHFVLAMLTLPFDKEGQRGFSVKFSYIKYFPAFVMGLYYEKGKNPYKAIDLYSQAIEKVPGFLPFYVLLGNVYKSLGKVQDAINEYRMALWVDPNNITSYKCLCTIYEEVGDYSNAIKMYEKLLEMNPNDAIAYSSLANVQYLNGNFEAAIASYQTAITLNPNKNWTSIIAQTLGYILHESKTNYDAAISAYQSASLLNPADVDIYINLGSTFYEKGDYDNALIVYKVALGIDPNNARIHCNLGYIFWGKGDIQEAMKEYELSISLDSEYDIAYNNLGVIYLDDLGYVQKSIDYFEKAIECNSNYALAYYNLARAISIKGNKIEAARLYQIAMDLNLITNELDNNEIKSRIDNLFK